MSFLSYLFNRKEQVKSSEINPSDVLSEGDRDDENKEEAELTLTEDQSDDPPEGDEDRTEYEVVEREILPNKILCPDCGGITLEGLEFCDKCGGELL